MTVRSKATGAAMMIAAPEVGAATKAAGAAKGAKAAGAAKGAARGSAKRTPKRITTDMSPDEVNAELQQRRQEAASSSSSTEEPAQQQQPAAGPPPSSSGAGLPSLPMPGAASTGSGFLLGVFAWALGLAYLRGGSPEVKKFLSAKFLNKAS
jgi:hypothetical protein